jgi:spoIIIJ-associated protein
MSSYEFTGKTVKEAVSKACDELGVEEVLLDVEVLEESSKGFLGLVGHREARIKVRKRDILKEVMEVQEAAPAKRKQQPPAAAAETKLRPEPVHTEVEPESEEKESSGQPPVPSPHLDEARKVLQAILERIPVEAEVQASMDRDAIYLNIIGDGSGLLIGKKGQTLDALQYLVNKIINKSNPPGSKVELIVDTENYRLRKNESLREMAERMSQRAKKTLKPVPLTPMPPHERRIIHLILAEDREVYTKSYGEGSLRRIIIYPRRSMTSKRRRR